jgi:hypothetical protein
MTWLSNLNKSKCCNIKINQFINSNYYASDKNLIVLYKTWKIKPINYLNKKLINKNINIKTNKTLHYYTLQKSNYVLFNSSSLNKRC